MHDLLRTRSKLAIVVRSLIRCQARAHQEAPNAGSDEQRQLLAQGVEIDVGNRCCCDLAWPYSLLRPTSIAQEQASAFNVHVRLQREPVVEAAPSYTQNHANDPGCVKTRSLL